MGKVIDCTEAGHAAGMKVKGESDDDLLRAAEAHIGEYHPAMKLTREQILGMAKEE